MGRPHLQSFELSGLWRSLSARFPFPGRDEPIADGMAHGSNFDTDRDRHPDAPVLHKDLRNGLPQLAPGNGRMAGGIAKFQHEEDAQQNPDE